MPYRSGLFQAALGAISVAALVITHSFGGAPRQKRLVGTIQKTGEQSFRLTEPNAHEHEFQVSEPVSVFLNEKEIPFPSIENGRQASVRFMRRKGKLLAVSIEIFPTHSDFDHAPPTTDS
jgi:hypothetical protein